MDILIELSDHFLSFGIKVSKENLKISNWEVMGRLVGTKTLGKVAHLQISEKCFFFFSGTINFVHIKLFQCLDTQVMPQ